MENRNKKPWEEYYSITKEIKVNINELLIVYFDNDQNDYLSYLYQHIQILCVL